LIGFNMSWSPSKGWNRKGWVSTGAAAIITSAQTFDSAFKIAAVGLSVDKLTATNNVGGNINTTKATGSGITVPTFWEVTFNTYPNGANEVYGVCNALAANTMDLGQTANGAGYAPNGAKYNNGSAGALGHSFGSGGAPFTALLAYIPATHTLHHYIPSFGWDTGGTGDPVADTGGMVTAIGAGVAVWPAVEVYDNTASATLNFGTSPEVNTAQVTTLLANGFVRYI
jgi:hypothetical protein